MSSTSSQKQQQHTPLGIVKDSNGGDGDTIDLCLDWEILWAALVGKASMGVIKEEQDDAVFFSVNIGDFNQVSSFWVSSTFTIFLQAELLFAFICICA